MSSNHHDQLARYGAVEEASRRYRILVTGGAGFIGSHAVHHLISRGHDVIVVDDLSKGCARSVPSRRLPRVSLSQTDTLTELLCRVRPEAVIHFAAYISVGESMREPERYFANNVAGSLSLLTSMASAGTKHIVFSSTAAVYGTPHSSPIMETFPIQPASSYGESRVMVESLLRWFNEIHFSPASVCGTSMLPAPFGSDYAMPDGTCIRDYIHVCDLAEAHVLAVQYLINGGRTDQFNVGAGIYTIVEHGWNFVRQTSNA